MKNKEELKKEIFSKVKEYYLLAHQQEQFIPGKSKINYAGRVYDEKELINLVDSALEFWLTAGRYAKEFEKNFSEFLGVKHCILTNSGSSANLLAITALTSSKLGDRRLRPGDEVITTAACFPTTVAPIIQNSLVPVFVDVSIPTYNIDCSFLENALSEKTRAVFMAHTLGNPFDIDSVKNFCNKNGLWLIEDNCDSLGSEYKGKCTGTFGDIATYSFYPPHHMTMGEGGALTTDNTLLKDIICSFRDWGRDCWCDSGQDNACSKRFSWQLGKLPKGYDHKYTYSHFGYNLKVTDMQAAVGCAQLEKLSDFIEKRRRNFKELYNRLKKYEDYLILPEATYDSDPSWFGFLITILEGSGFSKNDIVDYLESKGIQTRMLFAGNIIKHPCFDEIRGDFGKYRVIGSLENTDNIMKNSFWIGVYPGMDSKKLNYIINMFDDFFNYYIKKVRGNAKC
jgi:CDP-6-deoxy-D-xylo-4-hexulose-3-dehydrase